MIVNSGVCRDAFAGAPYHPIWLSSRHITPLIPCAGRCPDRLATRLAAATTPRPTPTRGGAAGAHELAGREQRRHPYAGALIHERGVRQ